MRTAVPRRWAPIVLLLLAALGEDGCAARASHRTAEPGRRPRLGAVPAYPGALHAAGIEGEVELLVPVDRAGAPRLAEVRTLRATHALFRAAVLATVPQWRFAPAPRRLGGRATAASVRVYWRFVLARDTSGGPPHCPPPAFPPLRCGESASDTAAVGVVERTRVESPRPGALIGTTEGCPVPMVVVGCVGARQAGAPSASAPLALAA